MPEPAFPTLFGTAEREEDEPEALSPAISLPTRPRRHLKIVPEDVVESVLKRADQLIKQQDRTKWETDRLQRYAKLRGWYDPEHPKDFPWQNCADVHLPILLTAELRIHGGLFNVVRSLRPLFQARALQRANVPKEEHITELLHHQMFVEPGEEIATRALDDFLGYLLQDGNAVAYTPWVREQGQVTTVHALPRPPILTEAAVTQAVTRLVAQTTGVTHQGGNQYRVTYRTATGREAEAEVEVYLARDGTSLDCFVTTEATTYDGPVMQTISPVDVFEPVRSHNLQCPNARNPGGAPYVFLRMDLSIDALRRGIEDGTFNYLDSTGLATIEAQVRAGEGGRRQDQPGRQSEVQKDQLEGRDAETPPVRVEGDIGHLSVSCLLCFDRWDVNDDGLYEEVFWIVERESRMLIEARLLTEKWPVKEDEAPYRPLAEAVCVPVPGRWRGIGLLELGESLYDLLKGILDQAIDGASLANLPFGFYAAQSNLNADMIRLAPGDMYPVPGNPRETTYFPQLQGQNPQFSFNILSLGLRLFQDLLAIGSLQQGQVPAGRSSALRTTGTTLALLQQGDVRLDSLLLNLFLGLQQVVRNFHRMNRFLLPPNKEIHRVGYDGPRAEAYRRLRPEDIDGAADFEFRPDFLLSNQAVLTSLLQSVLGLVATPLALQLGISDPQLIYQTVQDAIKAMRLDPKRYVKPPMATLGPAVLAEEAISLIRQGRMPEGSPAEGAEAHLKKLGDFMASDAFGELQAAGGQIELFRAWTNQVGQQARQERMAQAAFAFQQQAQANPLDTMPGAVPEPAQPQPNQAEAVS